MLQSKLKIYKHMFIDVLFSFKVPVVIHPDILSESPVFVGFVFKLPYLNVADERVTMSS